MSNRENQVENPGMKTLSDFFVDIFGGLIPGVLFLFSIIVGIIGPIVYIFFQVKDLPSATVVISKESLLSSLFNGLFQGWFWVVIFLTFLILAYVVGHIFYRSDIKDVDKLAFIPLRDAGIYKIFVDFQNFIRFKHFDKYEKRKWSGQVKFHKMILKASERIGQIDIVRCMKKWGSTGRKQKRSSANKDKNAGSDIKRNLSDNDSRNTDKTEDRKREENNDATVHFKNASESEEKGENEEKILVEIKKYFCWKLIGLIRLIAWNDRGIKPDKEIFSRLFQDDNRQLGDFIETILNKDPEASTDELYEVLLSMDLPERSEDRFMKYDKFISALHKIVFPHLDFKVRDRNKGEKFFPEKTEKPISAEDSNKIKEIVLNYNLDATALDVINRYEKIVRKYFDLTRFEYKIKLEDDKTFVWIVVLYCILSVQSEQACESKETCNFPYSSYFKYLLKRDEGELAELARWHNENTRSKNMLNNYKTFIQLTAPKSYQIMVKIESHIRMASSSYYAAKVLRTWLWLGVLIIMVAFFIFNNDDSIKEIASKISSGHWPDEKIHLEQLIIILCPLFNLLLLKYLKKSILKFIHYQRLKEIFTSLVVYKYVLDRKKAAGAGDKNAV